MALLLAMYQKMRLIREKNQLVLEQSQYSSKLTRVEKNIERTQKRYQSMLANIDKQAQMMKSQASVFFRDFMGIGTNNYANSLNPMGFSGMNGFVVDKMAQMLTQNPIKYTKGSGDNKTDITVNIDEARFQHLYTIYMNNGGNWPVQYEDDNKTKVKKIDGETQYEEGITHYEVIAFTQAMRQAQSMQQQAQMWCQNATQQYDTTVSIWVEARKAEIEAEQDAALEPLNYQQTMWELEKTQKDARLKRIETELQTYTDLVSSEAEKTAPTFGLR